MTIKAYDKEYQEYLLDFPNDEVRKEFVSLIANSYFEKNRADSLVALAREYGIPEDKIAAAAGK